MKRIGIIGCENSHADGFADLFNKQQKYDGFRVVGVSGHYKEANKRVADAFGIENVYDDFRDMVGKVDAVMVTSRDGKYHVEFAKPFAESGVPIFVDKPFSVDYTQARELIKIAERTKSPICGGSSLKYLPQVQALKEVVAKGNVRGGCVTAPVLFDSEYSGFYFYASHLSEISLEIFGQNPKSVYAVNVGKDVCVLTEYENYCVSNHFANAANNSYLGCVISSDKNTVESIDISQGLALETDMFVNMVKTGVPPRDYAELLLSVKYMNAIVTSYTKKTKVVFQQI